MTAEMIEPQSPEIERMHTIFAAQKQAFENERHRKISERKADLKKIELLSKTKADEIAKVIDADFSRRSSGESAIAEISFTIATSKHTRKNLERWSAPKKVRVPMSMAPGTAYVRREPIGVVGIIAPWNYPFQLALAPLVAALGAGCRVMIKPSEYTPETSRFLKESLAEFFSEDHVAVIEGGPDVAAEFSSLPFDHLLYTGSTQFGQIVAKAAAENLTPVTLELGGKSPTVIAPDFSPSEAAKTVTWGKFLNAGQTCVAPDYVIVPQGQQNAFGEAVMKEVGQMWPNVAENSDYTAVISERHHARIASLVEDVMASGATVLQADFDQAKAGNTRVYPPTVVIDPPLDSPLMTEEIFGPVLPVLGHDGLTDAARFINERDRPLALYIYTKSKRIARDFLSKTISGGATVNAPMMHLSIEDLPFGGVGPSGQGAYHGEAGFLTFTHERGVFESPVWHPIRLVAPPYGRFFEFFKKIQMG
jgi:coniferyl-aldehyde dehydrogenase